MCSLCFVLFAIAARRGSGTRTSSGDTSRALTLLSRGATLSSFSPPRRSRHRSSYFINGFGARADTWDTCRSSSSSGGSNTHTQTLNAHTLFPRSGEVEGNLASRQFYCPWELWSGRWRPSVIACDPSIFKGTVHPKIVFHSPPTWHWRLSVFRLWWCFLTFMTWKSTGKKKKKDSRRKKNNNILLVCCHPKGLADAAVHETQTRDTLALHDVMLCHFLMSYSVVLCLKKLSVQRGTKKDENNAKVKSKYRSCKLSPWQVAVQQIIMSK